ASWQRSASANITSLVTVTGALSSFADSVMARNAYLFRLRSRHPGAHDTGRGRAEQERQGKVKTSGDAWNRDHQRRRWTSSSATAFQQLRNSEYEVLIAGCGTGQHAIETAWLFAGARLLTIDLSRTSLAYAARKTREHGRSQHRPCSGRHPQA